MMNDMKYRNLIEAFSQHEEKCIEEFCEFAKVIPPAEICHLRRILKRRLKRRSLIKEKRKKLLIILNYYYPHCLCAT